MEPTVFKFSSLSSLSPSSFLLSLVVIIFFITSAVQPKRLPLELENFNANDDNNRNYLQSAFQNATDPAVYQNFLRPSGNCRGHRKRRDLNASKLSKNQPLNVNMSLELYNYATVNDLTSEYTFQFFLDLEWCDERLILDDNYDDDREDNETDDKLDKLGTPTEERYSFIEGGQWHIDRIWRPSIFVANNEQAGSIDNDQQSSNMIRIDGRTGRIWLRKRKLLHIFCLMDFSLFPFDRQHCSVHFESNVDNSRHLRLNWGELFLDRNAGQKQRKSFYQDSNQFTYQIADKRNSDQTNEEIIHNHGSFRTIGFQLVDIHLGSSIVSGLSGVNFSRCTFDFTLQREFAHHLMLAYLPSALIVAVSWTSFWLEITSPPARVLLGVTTMLALVTNFKLTRDQLPSISYLNVLDVWNLVCITFIALSLVEFAVVNFIYNTQKRRKVLRAIKGRSERYREAQNKAEGLFKVGSSGSPKNLLSQLLFHRQIQAHDVSAETLGKLASLNSKLMTRTSNSQSEQNFLTDREMLADETNLSNDTFSKRKDRSYTVVSFADGVQSSGGVDSSAKMPRKYTTTTTSSSNGLLSPSTSNSASSSVPPVLKRVYSGESSTNSNTGTNSAPLTGSSRRGSTVSVQSDIFSANQRGRRKSLLISSSPEVPARFELTPEELAQRIDHWSRILFPVVFTLFNLLYWMSVFLRKAHSQAPKW